MAGLGGRVAEALFCQDISTGASQDIRHITQVARDMVAKYGMSEKIGPIAYSSDEEVFIGRDYEKTKSYSEQVAGLLDGEVWEIIDRAYGHCEKILQEWSSFWLTRPCPAPSLRPAWRAGTWTQRVPDPCLTRYKRGNLGAQGESKGRTTDGFGRETLPFPGFSTSALDFHPFGWGNRGKPCFVFCWVWQNCKKRH